MQEDWLLSDFALAPYKLLWEMNLMYPFKLFSYNKRRLGGWESCQGVLDTQHYHLQFNLLWLYNSHGDNNWHVKHTFMKVIHLWGVCITTLLSKSSDPDQCFFPFDLFFGNVTVPWTVLKPYTVCAQCLEKAWGSFWKEGEVFTALLICMMKYLTECFFPSLLPSEKG